MRAPQLLVHSCATSAGGQCSVYTYPDDWPVDVRANCESAGGAWDTPCAEPGRVGSCTCTGSGGISTVTYYYDPVWTAPQAATSCGGLGCAWSAQ
jgi:hypothetical protein